MAGESQETPGSRPDPSVMTTEQLDRAVAAERDFVIGQLAVLRQRLDGIDRATDVLSETINRTPTDIQKEIVHLRELMNVELGSIAVQFKERDIRQERESRDNEIRVNAAFAAAKESATKQDEANQKAIDKSEKATAETITKLSELFRTTTDGLAGKADDNKAGIAELRLLINGIIQSQAGGRESRTDHRSDNTALIAMAGLVLTLIIVGLAIAGFATQ